MRVTFDREELRRDVRAGLVLSTRKTLPPKYFYDERGSELFERITRLPEYYLTRAEREILARIAPEIVASLAPCTLMELGAGSAAKTRILIAAMTAGGRRATYVPVDVSETYLRRAAAALRADFPTLEVVPLVADFVSAFTLPPHEAPALHAFLGSTIGNFDPGQSDALLARIAARMTRADRFLLGVDLRKDPATVERAYDDADGVTAEFNRNVLRVLNAELGADFEPELFAHRVRYDEEHHRIEMYLEARADHAVTIPEVGVVRFPVGERILTEVSYKYDRPCVERMLASAGMTLVRWETDAAGAFALALAGVRG